MLLVCTLFIVRLASNIHPAYCVFLSYNKKEAYGQFRFEFFIISIVFCFFLSSHMWLILSLKVMLQYTWIKNYTKVKWGHNFWFFLCSSFFFFFLKEATRNDSVIVISLNKIILSQRTYLCEYVHICTYIKVITLHCRMSLIEKRFSIECEDNPQTKLSFNFFLCRLILWGHFYYY